VHNPQYERWRWQTFAITWLIYASFYLTRQSFGVAKVALESDRRVTMQRDEYGLVDSAFLATYMLGQFVFGPMGDRFGPRRILLFGLALSILAALATGFSTTFVAFIVFAVLQGIAQSTGWTNTTKTMSSWFSVGERGRVIGWWCTHYTVGAAIALPFSGWLMEYFGHPQSVIEAGSPIVPFWPAAFWGPAAVLAIVFMFTWRVLRNRPEDVGLPPIEHYHGEPGSAVHAQQPLEGAPKGSWRIIFDVLTAPKIWMLACAYFSIKLARYAFYFWGPKYVAESLGSNAYHSALTAAALPIGGLFGVVAIGYLSDNLFQARRVPVTIISLLITAATMLVGMSGVDNIWVMRGFLFAVGMFLLGPDSIISATAAMDFGTKRGAGTATGIVNGFGSMGAILGGYLPGVMTTSTDWAPLFHVFLVGLVISAVILLPMWRTKPPTS
jgi:OPA family sugar phosphate sensor protein UhpC-like MFS transporter